MNKAMLKGIVLGCSALALTACSDSDDVRLGGKGTISLSADVDATVVSSRPSRLEYGDVKGEDLSIRLTSADGSYSKTWDNVAAFTAEDPLISVGDYTLEAFYGDDDTEGFEYPRFYGSQSVKVRENQTTPVTVTASVANALVSIDYSDNFRDYMSAWSAELHAPGGAYIEYAQDETRPAYVKPGEVEIYVEYTKPNGKGTKVKAASFPAEAARHYHVSMDLEEGAGTAFLTVIFDEATEEQPVTIELSDELESAPAPELTAAGFTSGETFYIVPGHVGSHSLKLNAIARGKLGAVKMTTQCASLTAQGWPAEIDLLSATPAQQATLKSLGLSALGLFQNPDKMAVIDLSGVLEHITLLTSGDNTSTFAFMVEDQQGKASDAVTFSVVAEALALGMSNPGTLAQGATTVDVDLAFNAGNPSTDLQIQYLNTLGAWTNTTATYVEKSRGQYRATVTVPGGSEDVTLRARVGSTTSDEIAIKREKIVINATAAAADVFATSATISCDLQRLNARSSDAEMLDNLLGTATVMISTNGGTSYTAAKTTHTAGTSTLQVSGLNPGTTYTAKVKLGTTDYSDAPSFTIATESNQQIPNGNLDTSATKSSGNYWTNYTFDGWGTNNDMTTASGSAYAYVRISTAIPTDDSASGKAVLLRTCGWGSGNSATGSNGTSGTCKYTDAGLLHLGGTRSARPAGYSADDNKTNSCSTGPITTDDLAPLGIAFTSRPSSMTFKYKYSPKNANDRGYAEITMLDASGNVIATATKLLPAASTYQTATVELAYPAKAAKAAKIYVKFLSSYSMEYIKRTNDNFSGPGFGNLSNGTFMGSQLWLDDITLNY